MSRKKDFNIKLIKFDGEDWTVYDSTNSGLPITYCHSNWVSGIVCDGMGNKWIGAAWGGLVKYDDTNWTVYNTSNSGLPDNGVYDVALDSLGNIWLATRIGIVCFNENGIQTTTGKYDDKNLNAISLFFPNPSDKTVKVKYHVEKPGQVQCEVYDSGGRFIGKYLNKYYEAGEYETSINTSNLSPGVYMFKMKIGNRTEVKKVVVK